ncbi:AGAP011124-PA-like protein [Anopheles sinensis]|uniref:AGAP011124-PA-like protein n=1 Tax=Anopheles sinensis TaxID=74873 RepID=A0A084W798_ANOSI|nr:AGAP011124-PA-like protein [Anopheles sinensis]
MDFEDKKENIQPLKEGRNVEQLEQAFEPLENWEKKRKLQEEELEKYVGDDPLQQWYEYIFWIEQTNVSSGKPMILEDAVRRCVQKFENDPRYMQDQRFIKLCIKYIDTQPSPVELYNELYNRGVGSLCSDLYIAWAYYYDAVDNFAKTEEVFQKGLRAGAEPKADLEQAHKMFGFSMSQRLLYKDECSQMKFQSTLDERRNALTSLRASGRKNVGSVRTGLAVKSYRPGVVKQENTPSNGPTSNAPANAIIFSDEPGGSSETASSIVRPFSSVHNQAENIIESARLATSQGANKKSVLFPKHLAPSFDIPLDEEPPCEPLPMLVENYSRGIQLPANFCRRNKPQTPFEVSICLGDPKERAIPMYDKIRLYCRANGKPGDKLCEKTEYSPEELRAYRYFVTNGIDNKFRQQHESIWGRGYDIGIRLHPLHVREVKSQESVAECKQMRPPLEEPGMSFQTKIKEMYADPVEEKSIEELLVAKWREGKIKRCFDRRYQDDVDPVDMDETQVESKRISMGGARFSIAPSVGAQGTAVRAQMRQRRSIFPNNASPVVSKKEDTKPTPLKSALDHGEADWCEPSPPVVVAPEKVQIFVDDSDENDEREELMFPKPGTVASGEQPYYPNDTCSTQMFNMFVKNISTPVDCMLSGEGMSVPMPEAKINDENAVPTVESSTPPSTSTSTSSACNSTQSHKQLSTIMERTETSTTSASAITKSSVDSQENECVLRGTAIQANDGKMVTGGGGGAFHLPEDPTFTGMGGMMIAGQRNLSQMVQREMDANSIMSFRMTTERTNTVPLPLMKPQYKIPEVGAIPSPPSGSSIGSSVVGETTAVRSDNQTVSETLKTTNVGIAKKKNSLLEQLDATFSPKAGRTSSQGTKDSGTDGKENSFNLTDLMKPPVKTATVGLSQDLPTLESLSVPENDLSLLPVAQIKMEKSLMLDASLELPKFTMPTTSNVLAPKEAKKPSGNKEAPSCSKNVAKVVLDEFPSPGGNVRGSLEDVNTAIFSLNINHAINSTVIPDGFKTPRKHSPNTNSGNKPLTTFTITSVQGGVTDHPSLLMPAPKEVIDLSEVTISVAGTTLALVRPSTVVQKKEAGPRLSPFDDAYDGDASIYHPRPVIPQDDERWEEIDEHFDPQLNNEYQPKAVDLESTMQQIDAYTSADEVDPFDRQLNEAFLIRLDFMSYIADLPNCTLMNKLQPLKKGTQLKVREGGDAYEVQQKIGKGAYGTVFCGILASTGQKVALKQERPANLWEYYILLEIRSRLTNPDIVSGFMSIDHAYVGNNASIFVSEYSPYGNILDVCNQINKMTNRNVDEFIAMIITAQILSIVDHLHSCQIIHADIKPDNFLLISPIDLNAKQPCVQLIDFGESIDMQLFEKDVKFKRVITTDGFTCVEMREGRPWTYQPDLFGVAATSHVMLFGKYMQVQKNMISWGIKTAMPRYFKKTVWENYFTTLLNIRDCDHLPNLQNLRTAFLQEIALHEKYIRSKVADFNLALNSSK